MKPVWAYLAGSADATSECAVYCLLLGFSS